MKKIIGLSLVLLSLSSFAQEIKINLKKNKAELLNGGNPVAHVMDDKDPIEIRTVSSHTVFIKVENAEENDLKIQFYKKSTPGYAAVFDILKIKSNKPVDTAYFSDGKLMIVGGPHTDLDSVIKLRVYNSSTQFFWFFKVLNTDDKNTSKKDLPSGYALKDALILSWFLKNKVTDNKAELFNILTFYAGGRVFGDLERARKYFHDTVNNYFLSQKIQEIMKINDTLKNPAIKHATGTAGNMIDIVKAGITSAGNLDVTNFADGLAKFLVKRTKEELNITFFEKFKDEINKDEYADVRTLFPETYNLLNVIGDEIYNYNIYISALREAFEKDLGSLLTNMPKVIEDGRYKDFFNTRPDIRAVCLSSIYIANGLISKNHPGKIIEDYPMEYLEPLKRKDIEGRVNLGKELSFSLRSQSSDNYWLNADTLEMLKDTAVLKTYLGLLYQKTKDLVIAGDTTFGKIINWAYKNEPKIIQVKNYITGLRKQVKIVGDDIKNVLESGKDKISFQDYYNYYNSTLDLVDYLAQLHKLPGLEMLEPGHEYYTDMKIARSAGNLALDINKRNYSAAILEIFQIYEYATGGTKDKNKKLLDDIRKKVSTSDDVIAGIKAKATSPENKKLLVQLEKKHNELVDTEADIRKLIADKKAHGDSISDDISHLILKYGSFMAAVVQAQNSDDVEAAIEAIALPQGSSRIKRESSANIALNAYLGLYTGYEQIKGFDKCWTTKYQKINSWGLTAPVGISFSKGFNHRSISLFISIIDIGAVASFRFGDTTTAQLPTIQLKDIFSPGVFLSYGFKKCPISFNIGAQAGPNLRKVSATGASSSNPYNDYENRAYVRFSASVVVDLPLLNFYTKSK
ncbi:MAG TPA: hypothetical protein VNZ49_08540 [Bacteroidia bacterium]|jgi:hypothetical protein|nr:hypothetical protein [Bacteroidia bacterium]